MLTAIISFNVFSLEANIKLFFLCTLLSKKVLAAKLFTYVFSRAVYYTLQLYQLVMWACQILLA